MGRDRRATPAETRIYHEIKNAPVEHIHIPGIGWRLGIDTKAARKRAHVSKRTDIGTVF